MGLTVARMGGRAVYMRHPDAIGQGVRVGRRFVCFDFDERFGPLVVDRAGEPTDDQPVSDDNPFWGPFDVWLDGYWRAKGAGDLDAYLRKHDCTRPVRALSYPGRSHPKTAPLGEEP